MTAKDEKPEPRTDPPGPADDDADDDTTGHSSLTYDYTRQHAQERDREAIAWANREALRKQTKKPDDRTRDR